MDIRSWDTEPVEQLNADIGRQMAHTETMTVARILLARGAHVPLHAHANEQVTNVISGRLLVRAGGEERELAAGESVLLPGDLPHEVVALEDSVALDVFSPVRDDWVRGDDAYLRG